MEVTPVDEACPTTTRPMTITARGKISRALLDVMHHGRECVAYPALLAMGDDLRPSRHIFDDDDLQLSLFLLYALAYGSLNELGEDLEWDPELIALRRRLEAMHEAGLRRMVGDLPHPSPEMRAVGDALFEMTSNDDGPSLAHYVAHQADADQACELLILRSIYTLREADPHSWALPRLDGKPKAALVEIQADEYGGGRPQLMHSALFAAAMRGAGLSDQYGAYLDQAPSVVLAAHNTMSLFGLNRRLRGAVVGHLAAFEMTSSAPNRLISAGLSRLGYGTDVTTYFDVHVEADALHEQIAGYDLAGSLAQQQPRLVADIMFGAAASLLMDRLVAEHTLDAWRAGRSALRSVPGASDVAV